MRRTIFSAMIAIFRRVWGLKMEFNRKLTAEDIELKIMKLC